MRAFVIALIIAAILFCPCASPAQQVPPTAREVNAFVERAHSEKYVGTEVRVPDRIFYDLAAGVDADMPYCNPGDRKDLEGHQIFLGSIRGDILAIQGATGCFCSPTGNCDFWIYVHKAGKYWVILETGSVQMFEFLKSRTHGYPDLVTWSHGSATEYGGQLFRFNGKRYASSGTWIEDYEYLGDNSQIVKPDKPRITSYFTCEDELPKESKPSDIRNSNHGEPDNKLPKKVVNPH